MPIMNDVRDIGVSPTCINTLEKQFITVRSVDHRIHGSVSAGRSGLGLSA